MRAKGLYEGQERRGQVIKKPTIFGRNISIKVKIS